MRQRKSRWQPKANSYNFSSMLQLRRKGSSSQKLFVWVREIADITKTPSSVNMRHITRDEARNEDRKEKPDDSSKITTATSYGGRATEILFFSKPQEKWHSMKPMNVLFQFETC